MRGSKNREPATVMSVVRNDQPSPAASYKVFVKHIIDSSKFDACIGFIILANAVTIGIEQSFRLEGRKSVAIQLFQHIFLLAYLAELAARMYAFGLSCFNDHWVKFDAFLTTTGILYAWILDPVFSSMERLKLLVFLRLARLLRLAKVLRLLLEMRELYTLVRAIKNSLITFLYTLGILLIALYSFSYVGVEVIATHSLASDPEIGPHIDYYFRNLPVTMFTMIRFACLDNMSRPYETLVQEDWVLGIYFISAILIVGIVFMNLLSAAVINSSLEQSALDREAIKIAEEKERKQVLQDLRKLFQRIDVGGTGVITRNDIKKVSVDDATTICAAMGTLDLMKVFEHLDVDNSGSVEMDEFVEGMEVAMSTAHIECKRLEVKLNQALGHLRKYGRNQTLLESEWATKFSSVQATVDKLRETRARMAEHMPADRSNSSLEQKNAALEEQLAAADTAQQDILHRARGECQDTSQIKPMSL